MNRRRTSPVLINKSVEEDRRGSYYYKDYDSREEEITKERYGLALNNRMEQREELLMEKIEKIIERAMEKTSSI